MLLPLSRRKYAYAHNKHDTVVRCSGKNTSVLRVSRDTIYFFTTDMNQDMFRYYSSQDSDLTFTRASDRTFTYIDVQRDFASVQRTANLSSTHLRILHVYPSLPVYADLSLSFRTSLNRRRTAFPATKESLDVFNWNIEKCPQACSMLRRAS